MGWGGGTWRGDFDPTIGKTKSGHQVEPWSWHPALIAVFFFKFFFLGPQRVFKSPQQNSTSRMNGQMKPIPRWMRIRCKFPFNLPALAARGRSTWPTVGPNGQTALHLTTGKFWNRPGNRMRCKSPRRSARKNFWGVPKFLCVCSSKVRNNSLMTRIRLKLACCQLD